MPARRGRGRSIGSPRPGYQEPTMSMRVLCGPHKGRQRITRRESARAPRVLPLVPRHVLPRVLPRRATVETGQSRYSQVLLRNSACRSSPMAVRRLSRRAWVRGRRAGSARAPHELRAGSARAPHGGMARGVHSHRPLRRPAGRAFRPQVGFLSPRAGQLRASDGLTRDGGIRPLAQQHRIVSSVRTPGAGGSLAATRRNPYRIHTRISARSAPAPSVGHACPARGLDLPHARAIIHAAKRAAAGALLIESGGEDDGSALPSLQGGTSRTATPTSLLHGLCPSWVHSYSANRSSISHTRRAARVCTWNSRPLHSIPASGSRAVGPLLRVLTARHLAMARLRLFTIAFFASK
jgi:hypothetical protein